MPAPAAAKMLKQFSREVGDLSDLTFHAVLVSKPFTSANSPTQLDMIGVGSLFIVLLTGLFTGLVMTLQALLQLPPPAATDLVGGLVGAQAAWRARLAHPAFNH